MLTGEMITRLFINTMDIHPSPEDTRESRHFHDIEQKIMIKRHQDNPQKVTQIIAPDWNGQHYYSEKEELGDLQGAHVV